LVKKVLANACPGEIRVSAWASRARASVEKLGLTYVRRSACRRIASMIFGWPWPALTLTRPEEKSRMRVPSGV